MWYREYYKQIRHALQTLETRKTRDSHAFYYITHKELSHTNPTQETSSHTRGTSYTSVFACFSDNSNLDTCLYMFRHRLASQHILSWHTSHNVYVPECLSALQCLGITLRTFACVATRLKTITSQQYSYKL